MCEEQRTKIAALIVEAIRRCKAKAVKAEIIKAEAEKNEAKEAGDES